ncbi:MAG: RNA-directed DNA polymerase [Saprospirales bacterium]|nr:RNA-directed DNA polymerase [Saprospirales bacterium]
MKRPGYLIEQIADMANLELAWHKAQRGKGAKAQVFLFGKNLRENLRVLQAQILSGELEIGGYHYFTVYDPKKRQICAAPFPQRVLHHALVNVCHPYFEQQQIYDSYASRSGKGTYAALERAAVFNSRYAWFLKLDVRKYFDSLDHGVVRSQLCRLFKDPQLLGIFDRILDSYAVQPGRGVPIGNLTSQYVANHYLSPADHYARETLRVPAYVRYMDDMVLWHDEKAALLEAGQQIQDYIGERLKLELKPFCLNKNTAGLPFLGYLLYPGATRLAHRSRRRYIQKINQYQTWLDNGVWTQQEFQNHVTPLTAFTEHADAKAFRQKVHASMGV